MEKKKQILSDHIFRNKKFAPPFFHAFKGWKVQFQETPYLYKVFPELVWQGFLNEKYGVRTTAEITLKLLNAIQTARNFEKGKLFCMISNFELLTAKEIDKVLGILFLDNDYKKIVEAILPFMKLFPECPLKGILYNKIPDYTSTDLEFVKSVFKPLLDKTSKEATFVLANTIYYAFKMDLLKTHKGDVLLDLNEIEHYPKTEKSQLIASNLRASLSLFVQKDLFLTPSAKWHNYFWNHAYKLEPDNIDELYFE